MNRWFIYAYLLLFALAFIGCKSKQEPTPVADSQEETSARRDPHGVSADTESPRPAGDTAAGDLPAVAVVNGEKILRAHYDRRVSIELVRPPAAVPEGLREQFQKAVREKALNEMILEKILEQKVQRRGSFPPPSFRAASFSPAACRTSRCRI